MYAIAQRVLNRYTNSQGLNPFLHLHGNEFVWPDEPWSIPDTSPGSLATQLTEVSPGGNNMSSYLDVLSPDSTPRLEIESALKALWQELAADELGPRGPFSMPNPLAYRHRNVWMTFSVNIGLEEARALEVSELSRKIEALLDHAAR